MYAAIVLILGIGLAASCSLPSMPTPSAVTNTSSGTAPSSPDPPKNISTSLSWTASGDSTVTGYELYWGTASRTYTGQLNVGNQTSATVTGLDPYINYYFAVASYNANGDLSSYSNEVTSISPASPFTISVQGVTASGNDGDVPANTIDNNLSTFWASYGNGQWIQYDLGAAHTVRAIGIAFYDGTTQTQSFDIESSSDGATWTTLWSGSSSGTTNSIQDFLVPPTQAQYIRIVCHGTSASLWNRLTEAAVYGW